MTSVISAALPDYGSALELVFSHLSPEAQRKSIADLLHALGRGRIARHELLVAQVNGERRGAAFYLMQPDRTAFVWPPRSVGLSAELVADALLQELVARLEKADAWVGQTLLDFEAEDDRQALLRNGFVHLTDLQFLTRALAQGDFADGREEGLEKTPFKLGLNEWRFARLLEQTYVGTRDCPELEGMRTGEQALVSHAMSGAPERWMLYRTAGRDAGVLLLNDHVEQGAWELVYMGVAPHARGRGLAERMLIDGLRAAREAGRLTMMLAVDCRNDYARRIYDRLGFVETDRKRVLLYFPQSTRRSHPGEIPKKNLA